MDKRNRIQTYYDRNHRDTPIMFDINSSLTDQDYKMQTDVNYLLAHMAGHSRTPLYGVQDTRTFEDWSNEMALVKRRFMHLTPEERARFGNAQNFLKWCADPNNYATSLPSYQEQERLKAEKLKDEEFQEQKQTKLAKKIAEAIKGE